MTARSIKQSQSTNIEKFYFSKNFGKIGVSGNLTFSLQSRVVFRTFDLPSVKNNFLFFLEKWKKFLLSCARSTL